MKNNTRLLATWARRTVPVLLLAASGLASAQLISAIQVAPAAAKPGEAVTVTVQLDVMSGTNCGVRMHWGDGSTTDHKINQAKDVPLVVQRSWPRAGSYTVKAEGKTLGMLPKCGGSNREVLVTVSAPAVATGGNAPTGAGPCPAGWKLGKGGVSKNGAFTCTAKAGTALPAERPSCQGELTYFENGRRGQLGCRL
ncbi:hypothetical protein PE066_11385 [Ramlibacter tataouinensis]|uniref:hypothetical protein n=1 Tax=Ramlibacter tataouinensis TaxID=94132 RepID=UPI0022F3B91D|nr:hypothetical protein [Ramlibacter tataouinensis]WBY00085.1 hypothetical protein PE066_11385 [Ramlibacter tataouinensis]